MFQKARTTTIPEDKTVMGSVSIHVQMLEHKMILNPSSTFNTLIAVNANSHNHVMEEIDLSVVYVLFDYKLKEPIFEWKRDAVSFGHTFSFIDCVSKT
jgi:hypothetical protein